MSDPQQSWNQPGPQPWGQQPSPPSSPQPWAPQQGQPSWGPQQGHPQGQQHGQQHGQAAWGGAPRVEQGSGGSTPLLVLGLATAVLIALGTFLPSVTYPDGLGSYGPLFQRSGDYTYFQASGLVLLLAAGVLVAGAFVQRSRAGLGTGLLLVGAGMVAQLGGGQILGRLQALLDDQSASIAVGGVFVVLAGLAAVATAVVGLVRVARLR